MERHPDGPDFLSRVCEELPGISSDIADPLMVLVIWGPWSLARHLAKNLLAMDPATQVSFKFFYSKRFHFD